MRLSTRKKKKKKKKKTTCKPRTAPAYGRAVKKKQRVNLEPPRPMAARLKKTSGRLRTAPAYGRAVNKTYRLFALDCYA